MFLNKRSNGYYYIHYDNVFGKRKSISTKCKTKVEANNYLTKFNVESISKKDSNITFEKFIQQYLSFSASNHEKSNTERIRFVIRHFIHLYNVAYLNQINPSMLEEYKTHRLESVKPVTVNIELRALKAIFSKAVDWDLIDKNPMKKVKQIKIPEAYPLFLTQEEYKKLIEVIHLSWLRNIVSVAVNTGMRRNELINLKWSDISFEQRILQVINSHGFKTKSKHNRIIPMNDNLIKLLSEINNESEYVFVYSSKESLKPKQVTSDFKEAIRKAKLNPCLHFHSLRHTFASWLVQKGVSLYHVSKLLGHADIKTTMIYSHLGTEDLRSAVDKLD